MTRRRRSRGRHPPPAKTLEQMYYQQKGRCHYCKMPMVLGGNDAYSATRDHILPRVHGGKNRGNLVAACRRCNNAKGNMSAQKFRSTYRPNVPLSP